MPFRAGSAEADYILNIDQPRRAAAELRAMFASIKQQQQALTPPSPVRPPPSSGPDPAIIQQRAERAILARAAAEARLAQIQNTGVNAVRGLVQAEQIYAAALAKVDQNSTAAIRTQGQLAAVQNRLKSIAGGGLPVLPRTVESFGTQAIEQVKSGLLGIVGPAALVTAGFNALRGAGEAAQRALDLREAQNALRAVAGSAHVYADALAVAQKQQVLFGGTLQDNIEGLQGLVITSRDTGASLQALVDLSARLNIKSPEQGIAGARIALQEAFSEGNITSLARRFEIPRAALAKFKDESVSTAEKVQILSGYLDSVGISSAAVAGKADQTALAYRNLNAELEKARLNAGGQLADAFARQATGLARLFGIINGSPEAIAQLLALQNGKGIITQEDIDRATQLVRLNTTRPSEDRAQNNAFARDKLAGVTVNTDALNAARGELTRLAITSDAAALRVAALYDQFAQTGDIEAFLSAAVKLDSSLQLGTRSTEQRIDALAKLRDEMNESAEASVNDAAQQDAQQAKTALLAAQTRAAVDEFLRLNPTIDSSAAASLAAAEGYSPQIQRLIAMQVEADNAAGALGRLNIAQGIAAGAAGRNAGGLFLGGLTNAIANGAGTSGGVAGVFGAGASGAFRKADAEQRTLQDSRDQLALARAKTRAARIAILERQLARQTTEEGRNRILSQIEAEKQSGAGRLSSAESTALRLNDISRKSGDDRLRIERENLERLRDQQEDFDVRRARSQEDFERQRRRLLAEGKRAEAGRLAQDFARDQQREQEDFDRQRRRTLRNNAESLGDQSTRVDNQLESINARTAARGGARVPSIGGGVPPADIGQAGSATSSGAINLSLTIAPLPVLMDGVKVAEVTFPRMEQLIDASLADEFGQLETTLSSSAQVAVAGA